MSTTNTKEASKKTHWKKLTNPNYIGAHDLYNDKGEKGTFDLVIKSVIPEMVKTQDGKEEECVVCYFEKAKKPMILNKTNMKIIANKFDTPIIEEWAGHTITLYIANVRAFGSNVEALRIRA